MTFPERKKIYFLLNSMAFSLLVTFLAWQRTPVHLPFWVHSRFWATMFGSERIWSCTREWKLLATWFNCIHPTLFVFRCFFFFLGICLHRELGSEIIDFFFLTATLLCRRLLQIYMTYLGSLAGGKHTTALLQMRWHIQDHTFACW